ncbi:hypothetical protein PMO31116_01445 [Pandoraea morbifera]|uniref:Uncharacterized protein n=1 Tax=Pandoraea morbifera TaxID=2508300 RepID=A0A5E4TJC6_9BURK|nr:hypothetical protein [Pandoraea morbifera]VVD88007.1 hypothetical protein PMO31116_01445 [Pandoraea morbifera]
MKSWADARRMGRGALQMKQLQERDLQDIAARDAKLSARYDALAAQRDAVAALIESSRLSHVEAELTELRGEMRAVALLRGQVRELEVRLTALDESREQLATDRELAEMEWRRWWRKETKYSRMAESMRRDARKRAERVEAGELEDRQSWKAWD